MVDDDLRSRVDAEVARRVEALRSFRAFRQWMQSSMHPDFAYEWEPHHEVIGHALQQAADGEIKRLIISASPGCAKTTLHVQFRVWWACRNPNLPMIAVAATQNLAESIGRRVRSAMQTPEFELLSGTQLHQDQQGVAGFGYGNGGVQASFGIGAKLIGRRSALTCIDDYTGSFEDVATESMREKCWEWFRGALMSRSIPGTPIIVIGTRWDQDDLIGKILSSHDANEWTHIRLPMEADSESDPLGRNIGTRLWQSYYNQSEIDGYKLDVKNWHCMWQCRPLVIEHDWLPLDNLPIIDERPQGLTSFYAGVDIALTENAGDWTVIIVGALTPDRKLVLLDMVRKRITPDKIVHELVIIHKTYNISEFLIDDDNASKTLMSLAVEMMRKRGQYLPFRPMPMRGQNKELRASNFKALALTGSVQLLRGQWNEAFLREVSQFPRQAQGVHDDCIDSAGVLAKRVSAMSAGDFPGEVKSEPIKGAFHMHEGRLHTTSSIDEMWADREAGNRNFGIIRL
jgi:predicted phage terminase large subunit-like protein